MKAQRGYVVWQLVAVLLFLAGAWGWIWNIIKLAQSSFDPLTGLVVLRCFGIFIPPLGAILGFI
jgi:hypothetical protein